VAAENALSSALMRSPSFWSAFFWDREGETTFPFPATTWRLEVDDLRAFVLRIAKNFSRVSLSVEDAGGEPIELAWDDLAHWHPEALRWDELDAIARAVAWRDSSLPHPGVLVLLLCRFAPMTEGEDGDLGASLLQDALAAADMREETIECVWGNIDVRHAGMRWREHPGRGFVLEQNLALERASGRPLHTLRSAVPENPFPFAELQGSVNAARLTCYRRAALWQSDAVRSIAGRYVATGARDVLPELREALERARCDDPLLLRACDGGTTWPIEHLAELVPGAVPLGRAPRSPIGAGVAHVHVPFAPLGGTSVHTMIESLRRAFEREGAGRIVCSSTEYGAQGVSGVSLSVTLQGDRATALGAARQALEALGAEGASIR
jgi:hypothetical protein